MITTVKIKYQEAKQEFPQLQHSTLFVLGRKNNIILISIY